MAKKQTIRRGTKYVIPEDWKDQPDLGLPAGDTVKVIDYTDDRVYLEDDAIGIVGCDTKTFASLQAAQA